ncbi:YybH family protein [Maribellus mangrovi]|uniref:YybH family protein n=1 Tax=Maribellus mangrovi TaxID=3133146 RepID=UPI0030EBBF4C
MKNKLFFLTLLITLSGIFSACSPKVDYAKEEVQIRAVWSNLSEYLAKGDWENYSNLVDHTEKLQILHPQMGQWLKGYDEFSKVYKGILESDYTYEEYENELLNINISTNSDMAWANAKVTWSMYGPDQKNRMWYSVAFTKVDGEWKIVMLMACNIPNKKND